MDRKESDYIVRATAADGQIRAFAAYTGGLTEQARAIHDLSPVACAALGRLLTAGAMMGAMLKGEEDLLTLQIRCDGPIKGLTVTADSRAAVKGYAYEPQVMLPPSPKGKLDVGGAIGGGTLSVIRDMGLKEPYTGQTRLVSGEIAEDLTYYFAASEQVPSSVALGVLMNRNNTVRQAGGFILQLMPFAGEDVVSGLEKQIGGLAPVTSMLDNGMGPEEILSHILGAYGLIINDTLPASFYCNCSRERVRRAVAGVGKKELAGMIEDGEPIEVNCHFCGKHYLFDAAELKRILAGS